MKAIANAKTQSIVSKNLYEQGLKLLSSYSPEDKRLGIRNVTLSKIDPNNVPDLITIGKAYLSLHHQIDDEHINTALIMLKRAVALEPNNLVARNLLGMAYKNIGVDYFYEVNWTDALDSFRDALIQNPNDFISFCMLEIICSDNQLLEIKTAVTNNSPPFDAPSEINSKAVDFYKEAVNYGESGDWVNSFIAIQKSLDVEPTVQSWFWVYVAAEKLGYTVKEKYALSFIDELRLKYLFKFSEKLKSSLETLFIN